MEEFIIIILINAMAFFILAFLLINQSLAGKGIDIVGPLTATAFGCLQQQENVFAFVRAYQLFDTYGDIDPNAI